MKKRFLEVCEDTRMNKCGNKERAFIPRFLTSTSLPHSDPKSTTFEKTISFGQDKIRVHISSPHGVPYGVVPRRLMAWIGKQAVQSQSPIIDLGRSQSSFLCKLEMLNSGGKTGVIKRFQEQAEKLFSSAIYIECQTQSKWGFEHSTFAKSGSVLWDSNNHKRVWSGELVLSDDFYKELIKSPVPVDMRKINAISSSLALDIYYWLNYKSHHLKAPVNISWEQLFVQFGGGYKQTTSGKRNWKQEFLKSLRVILSLYQQDLIIGLCKENIFIQKRLLVV